ncbi:hypothetical protein AXG93_3036s1300 [Marchantia polymorpha subsp. ruderalis]|uniref:Uncharacterized protein n=1 Tax=Marchantia polymorpha subsp. ruderalis TaxID=1480154 RepID=A0A176W8N0_MARPO|nr:hypothetical protein AXG93_3036s1300 [Marchantia polymorpha subsp. ruderalis]
MLQERIWSERPGWAIWKENNEISGSSFLRCWVKPNIVNGVPLASRVSIVGLSALTVNTSCQLLSTRVNPRGQTPDSTAVVCGKQSQVKDGTFVLTPWRQDAKEGNRTLALSHADAIPPRLHFSVVAGFQETPRVG